MNRLSDAARRGAAALPAVGVVLALVIMLALSGCGANAGRCGLTSPGYPLCGI